jgi:Ca2+-binding EF-hand superfamily protein
MASEPAHSEEAINSYIEVFKSFDTNGSGTIEPHELVRILNKIGIKKSPKEVSVIIKEVDYNGDNEINFAEFLAMLNLQSSGPTTDDALDAIFDSFAGKHLMCAPDDGMSRMDLSLASKALNEPMEDSEIDCIFEGAGILGSELMNRDQFRAVFRATQK